MNSDTIGIQNDALKTVYEMDGSAYHHIINGV